MHAVTNNRPNLSLLFGFANSPKIVPNQNSQTNKTEPLVKTSSRLPQMSQADSGFPIFAKAQPEATKTPNAENNSAQDTQTKGENSNDENKSPENIAPGTSRGMDGKELSRKKLQILQKLKQRDQEVKQHEQAHLSAAGGFARGAAKFTYQIGPDGQRYAVGGEVSIDISAAATPRQTIQKMDIVRRAALAPANPSSKDRNVAAAASRKELSAQVELSKARKEEQSAKTVPAEAPKNQNNKSEEKNNNVQY